jgi:hypothetical protein
MGLNDKLTAVKMFRKNTFAYRLQHGGIEIEGILYIGYSMTEAIRTHRKNYP